MLLHPVARHAETVAMVEIQNAVPVPGPHELDYWSQLRTSLYIALHMEDCVTPNKLPLHRTPPNASIRTGSPTRISREWAWILALRSRNASSCGGHARRSASENQTSTMSSDMPERIFMRGPASLLRILKVESGPCDPRSWNGDVSILYWMLECIV